MSNSGPITPDAQFGALLISLREAALSATPGLTPTGTQEWNLQGLSINGYTMTSILGQGAAGVVYGALDPDGNEVAVKILPKQDGKEPDAVTLFEREVKIGQILDHPAVVHTYTTFEFGPAQFVVMERVNGETLNKQLGQVWEISRFLNIFGALSEGLQAAHQEGVVHRDLKPENIMIGAHGEVKILDFGMARLMKGTSVTATGVFKGTVKYTSPEQLKDSKRVGPATDQFAFGLIAFEALTESFPYNVDEKQPMLTLMARVSEEAAPLSQSSNRFGEETEQVMARMLSMEPEDRYPTVAEAFASLSRSLQA